MPNWCNNNISITADKKTIIEIEKIVSQETNDDNGLLNYFHPMPKELQNTTSPSDNPDSLENKTRKLEFGADSWYDWRVKNWSTKWDIADTYGKPEVLKNGKTIEFGFDSAWAPPVGAYEHWLSKNPKFSIRATYHEPGCDFMGIWDNGEDICYEISTIAPKGSVDNFWTSAEGKELDDLYGITENMAQYEAEQEEERIGDNKEIIDYSKGEKVNV